MSDLNKVRAAYLVKPEFKSILISELGGVVADYGDLLLADHCNARVCFAQDIWFNPSIQSFQSISEAVKILRQAGCFWTLHPISHIRRSKLISEQLRKCPDLSRSFPITEELPKVHCFSLLDANTLLFATRRAKNWPMGQCHFIEDKTNPPNRAYLKLWEALSLLGKIPQAGDKVLDLGASPGGWTYVMQSLGAEVTAVDKACLDPRIMKLPRVKFIQQSAFALDPMSLNETYDWVLSDVACYPNRAYALIQNWLKSGKARHLIVTVKLQGEIELATLRLFQDIPGGQLLNLYHNKHEATFFYQTET